MDQRAYPSLFVVDSHATRPPPVPPRLVQKPQRAGAAQTLLFLLLSVALCGVTVEACLIYRLYQTQPATSASSSKVIAGQDVSSTQDVKPSKPVAHLTDGNDVVQREAIMEWSLIADPLLYEIDYRNKSLIIQKAGYYYVYSKVFFSDSGMFHHYIDYRTDTYARNINLVQSRKYSSGTEEAERQSNSYLGGVFRFNRGDAIFVRVNNVAKIRRHKSSDNFFGAYMI